MLARRALRALSAAVLASAMPLSAQVTGPSALHFVGGSGVSYNGWQVGAYKATLDNAPISIWCVDFFNHSANAQVWVSGLGGTNPDLSKTRFGTLAGQPTLYKQAAALTTLFATTASSEWGYIHYAIWELMSDPFPHAGIGNSAQTKINGYLAWSAANWTSYDYSKMYVLTDVAVTGQPGCQGVVNTGSCGAQEYLTGSVTVTPEPAVLGLMAFGLVGMSAATVVRRRKRS